MRLFSIGAIISFFISLNLAAYTFDQLDQLMEQGIDEGIFPGAVALIGYRGEIIYHKAFGHYTYDKSSPKTTINTLFDLASITKIIATTTAAMLLCDAKLLSPEEAVGRYIDGFSRGEKSTICIKHLLTHTSGLTDEYKYVAGENREANTQKIDASHPITAPGETYVYRDVNMLILQRIIEQITNMPLDLFVAENVTKPLGMHNTMFKPIDHSRCAPTEANVPGRAETIQGEVHDPQSFALGGVAGHAGLFSTAEDLAKYIFMILADGIDASGNQFISSEIVAEWRKPQCPFNRGYGWEIGRHLSPEAFGHFGWTGTSIWADKKTGLFCILLTNRTYPNGKNFKIRKFRITFHDLVMQILGH